MTNQVVDRFEDRVSHTCEQGFAQLQGRYLEASNEYRTECPDCNEVIYWDENGVHE